MAPLVTFNVLIALLCLIPFTLSRGEGSGGHSGGGGHGSDSGVGRTSSNVGHIQYSSNRNLYKNTQLTCNGPWNEEQQSGWYGLYNSLLTYWYYLPADAYPGYDAKYKRYNTLYGYFYSPVQNISAGSEHTQINNTAYTDHTNNYRTTLTFNTPAFDIKYFSTSDPAATDPDFAFQCELVSLVVYNGTNILKEIPLDTPSTPWTIPDFRNEKADNRTFFQGTSMAFFEDNIQVTITFRASNVQVNSTFSLPVMPNSIMFDVTTNYSVTAPYSTAFYFRINTSEPILFDSKNTFQSVAGASIGAYSEGRVEFLNYNDTVSNLSDNTTMLKSSNISGFAFVDVDVLNSSASKYSPSLLFILYAIVLLFNCIH